MKTAPNKPDPLVLACASAAKEAIEKAEHRKVSAEEFDRIAKAFGTPIDITEDTTEKEYEFEVLSHLLTDGLPYEEAQKQARDEASTAFAEIGRSRP